MPRTLHLPSRRRKVKMGTRKDDGPIRCDAHLQWVRGFECLAAGTTPCEGRVESAHVRSAKAIEAAFNIEIPRNERPDGGAAQDPSDCFVVPLCGGHHRTLGTAAQHTKGEASFWRDLGINPLDVAKRLWQQSPAGQRWRARQENGE